MDGLRRLTANERALPTALLTPEFPGVGAVREQARDVLAAPGCTCGCGSIDLYPQGQPPASSARNPLPSEGVVRDTSGEEVGGLLCFVEAGLLSYLEVYDYDEPLPLPPDEQVEWVMTAR